MTNRSSSNAPRPEDVGSFWNRITSRGGGPSKPSRFLIQINPPSFPQRGYLNNPQDMNRLRDLTFQCEATELPGRSLSTSDVQIAGPTFKLPYGSAYQDITFTFICTNDMYEKRIFDDWLNYINNIDNFTFNYRDEYATTIGIFQYDEGGDVSKWPAVTYGVQLIDAYPIAINQLSLAWGEDSVHRLGITFAYTYYRPIGQLNAPVPLPDLGSLTGSISSISSLLSGSINGAFSGFSGFLSGLF